MKTEVDAKNASADNYAYLYDRVSVNTGKQQLYCTQMFLNADATSFEVKFMSHPEHVNDRRKSMGLGTIESYIEIMNEQYRGELKKR